MPNILNPELESYLHRLENTVPRSETLQTMETYAKEKSFPIVGPLVGRMMATVALSIGAKRVLELGSGFGYSAIWFAWAIGRNGSIVCTDGDEKNRGMAQENFRNAKVSTPIEFKVGDALSISRTLSGPFDIVFCDIDKHEYPDAIDEAARLLHPDGVFFTDNTLWSAKIVDVSITDKYTEGVREFNRRLFTDRRFSSTILPIRDGVAMAVKIGQ